MKDYGGFNIQSLYVTKKFETLKEETLQHITVSQWTRDVIYKADKYIKCDRAKTIVAQNEESDLHYGIEKDAALTIQNIIVIIIYCNFSDLSTEFSASFRRKKDEMLENVKEKHRQFWWLAKILRETVEYYGNNRYGRYYGNNRYSQCGPFYTGLNKLFVMPQFNIRLCSPTSTTTQKEIAQRFAGDRGGMILTFDNDGDSYSAALRCFNCSWISQYGLQEQERLFMGGYYKIRIKSLTILGKNIRSYNELFHALFWFDCLLNGSKPYQYYSEQSKQRDFVNDADTKWISRLIDDQSKGMNRYKNDDKYPFDSFASFCINKVSITLNSHYVKLYYMKFYNLIETNIFDNIIFNLFHNVRTITIFTTSNYGIYSY
eukprot:4958_1